MNILDCIGNTPLIEIDGIYAKLESRNPGGSVKDRIALGMVLDAEKKGKLKPGDTIVEPTSGNTGIGLALVAAVKGYKLILTMPDGLSVERQKLLKAYGAELVIVPGTMQDAVAEAERISGKGGVLLQQFNNLANPATHENTTAVELMSALPRIDVFVATVGTGGTLTGVARALKNRMPVRVIAVEPAESAVLSGKPKGTHDIQGIGAGFIPKVLDRSLIDEIVTVRTADAHAAARELAKRGCLVGMSSGAAYHAAMQAKSAGQVVVTIFPDSGERYLSTKLF